MMPAYLSYRLTGVMKNEYTIASTTSLVNAETRDWDEDLITRLGMNPSIFEKINRLPSLLPQVKMINKKVKYIDLRWESSYIKLDE